MICVFLSFMLGDQRVIKEFGFGLAAAVFLDALVVRCVLLPAVLEILGPPPGTCRRGSTSGCRGSTSRAARRPPQARARRGAGRGPEPVGQQSLVVGRLEHDHAVLSAEAERVDDRRPHARLPGLERDVIEIARGICALEVIVGGRTPSRIDSSPTIADSEPAAAIRWPTIDLGELAGRLGGAPSAARIARVSASRWPACRPVGADEVDLLRRRPSARARA